MASSGQIADVSTETIDPITFEVVRGKLAAITEEQAITLKSVSGSPVVTEATDFNTGLYLADGSIATMGQQVLLHTGTMSSVIRSIIKDFSARPGIREGDMFILNDPYRGAVHQPDVSIVAPIFHDGTHVAWAGSCAHQLDVGGMSFGSWAVKATEIQQESMLLPGIKLVDGGELREDLWQMIMGMTRLPHVLGLDLKAMIAANRTAERRLGEVMDRYGVELVKRIMVAEIEASERQLRARLRRLPDGVFRARDFLEHDGHSNQLYQIEVALRKRDDELVFDLSGSSPQAPGFINCTRSGLVGAIFTAMLPILAPDIRWNEGILRPVTISAPEGLICNARWPAPASAGTVSAVWVVVNAATMAVSRLAACAPETRAESPGVTKGSMWVLTLAGQDRDGGPFGTFLLDSTVGGAGAYIDHDGLDASGEYPVPRPAVANVESNEASGPYLYLYRRLLPDTGGPGRTRGGVASGLAITPHDTDRLHAMLIGHGVEVPNSTGVFGGMEAACNQAVLRPAQANGDLPIGQVTDPESIIALGGEAHVLGPKPGHFDLAAGDVLAYGFQGGGGYGDPIERDPADVVGDVKDGFVTVKSAREQYGVVIEHGQLDVEATADERAAIRAARLGGRRPTASGRELDAKGTDIGGAMLFDESGQLYCYCGLPLGRAAGNFKDRVLTRVVEPESHGTRIKLHERLELREHICPNCAALLESEVAVTGAPSLHTMALD
jgi:N-methylhydantoinase B